MSALSKNDPGDPRSHRYYAPRQRRVVAPEATLQPVLERLRGSTREYSEDERLGGGTDRVAVPEPEVVLVPDQRFPFAALAAFAGSATAVAAVAIAYIVFGTNGASPVAAAAPSMLSAAQAAAASVAVAAPSVPTAQQAPAKIDARVAPDQPFGQAHAAPVQVATAAAAGAVPVDTAKGDRLDASANPAPGAAYDPLQSPLSLWSLSPTQAAIEGADPALAAPGATPPAESVAAAAAPPPPAVEHRAEHHAVPARHQVHHRHYVRHAHHRRHRKTAATGEAGSAPSGQNGDGTNGAASEQTDSPKKFLGLFGG